MSLLDSLITGDQFTLPQAAREAGLLAALNDLTAHHYAACPAYARLLDGLSQSSAPAHALADVPAIPVGLFKRHTLKSIPDKAVFRTLTSSGTSGQAVSRIAIDQDAARLQTLALGSVMSKVLGPHRLPMLIIDSKAAISRTGMNARAAGILGMMTFGRTHTFALTEDMTLDHAAVAGFLEQFGNEPFFVFGFTFMIWSHLLPDLRADLSRGILIHGGGWKTLTDQAVDNAAFKTALASASGLENVHNFYGMVEQIGTIFLEDDDGWLRSPHFADVIIRDPLTWREAAPGVPGVIQVLSALPRSYPGHSITTEDIGLWHPEQPDSPWTGRRLRVLGRVPQAELRGCSDVLATMAETRS